MHQVKLALGAKRLSRSKPAFELVSVTAKEIENYHVAEPDLRLYEFSIEGSLVEQEHKTSVCSCRETCNFRAVDYPPVAVVCGGR